MRLGGWLIMLSTMIVFLTLVGFETGLSDILTSLGINLSPSDGRFISDIESSGIWAKIFSTKGIIVAVIASGLGSLTIGLFGKGYDVSLVYAPFIVFIAGIFGKTSWAIISLVNSYDQFWMTSIVGLIFVSLGIGFLMSCIDYFGGRG